MERMGKFAAPLLTKVREDARTVLAGCRKSPPAAFSLRSEAQRTEAYASPFRSLRPCWTAFLSILRGVLLCFRTSGTLKFQRIKIVFTQVASYGELLRYSGN